jgi:hypothetical protein
MNVRLSSVAQTFLFIFVGLNGILEFSGVPSAVTKFLLLGVIIVVFLLHGLENRFTLNKQIVLLFTIIVLLSSAHIWSSSNIVLAVSLFQVFSPLVLYYLLESLMAHSSGLISQRILIFWLVLQIIGALVKFFVIGQGEGQGIGTVSIQAGAVSAYVVVIFCLSAIVLNVNKKASLSLLGLALLFALINEKRIGILVVGFFSYLIFAHGYQFQSKFFQYFLAIALTIGILFVGSVAIPSLLEGMSVLQFGERVWAYLLLGNEDGAAVGRLAGLIQTISNLESYREILFGNGPSMYLSSSVVGLTNNTNLGFNAIGSSILIGRFGLFGLFVMLGLMFILLKRQKGRASRFLVLFMIFDIMIYSAGFFLSYLGVYILLSFRSIEMNRSIHSDTQPA